LIYLCQSAYLMTCHAVALVHSDAIDSRTA
jgi:hypothetical protein